ncbi:MAG: recombinase family protein [Ruminococcus sp.]|nr:recombinase family protein [Ruminococcus sp.]
MKHSLAAQVSYYSNLIQKHVGWLFCGVYADEALTGTKSDREQFQTMLSECRAGNVDMIITKSISRFSRNSLSLLETIRELKDIGVDVFFEEQNLHSTGAEGELMLTILASFAQAESYSASENMKWRIRKSFEKGEIFNLSLMYGYDKKEKGLVINPTEAKIVREIFARAINGDSLNSIAQSLNKRGYTTKHDCEWNAYRIACMLRNEKYTGNSLLQKTYMNNHLEKKKLKNKGQLPQYYAEETHDGIIDSDTFEQVQVIMAEKARKCLPYSGYTTTMFTSFIRCGKCGYNYKRGCSNKKHFWNCRMFLMKGKSICQEPRIPEDLLYQITSEIIGVPDFTEDDLTDSIIDIVALDHTLTFHLTNGETIEREWHHKSRAESWTPEMKEIARKRAIIQWRNA